MMETITPINEPTLPQRIPLVDQILDVAALFPSGCMEHLQLAKMASQIIEGHCTPIYRINLSNP